MLPNLLTALASEDVLGGAQRHLLQQGPIIPNNPTYSLQFSGGDTTEEVLAIALIVVGIIVCLFGIVQRHTMMAVALLAFSWGGFYYGIYRSLPNISTLTLIWASCLASLGVAALALIAPVGYFLTGAAAGCVVWWAIWEHWYYIYQTGSDINISYGILGACAGGMGLVTLALGAFGVVVATPIVGAFLAIQGFNYFDFANANVNVFLVLDRDSGTCAGNKCLIMMSCFAAAVVLGWLVQAALFRRIIYAAEVVETEAYGEKQSYVHQPYEAAAPAGGAAVAPNYNYGEAAYNTPDGEYPTMNVGNRYQKPHYYA